MTTAIQNVSRRSMITGAMASLGAAVLPRPANAFLPFLLRGLIGGTVGRAAVGRAAVGSGLGRAAGAGLQRRTNAHLAARLARGASDIIFSNPVDSRYNGLFADGAEVAVTRFNDRELVSFVSCADDMPVPVVHPIQLRVMDYARLQIEARLGPAAPFETIYPARLLYSAEEFGFARIEYQTLRGRVRIILERPHPDAFVANMAVAFSAPNGRTFKFGFRSVAVRRPAHFE